MDKTMDLTEIERDALKEIGNVGTGNAATALSKFLNKHIEIIIPETKFIPITQFADEFGGADKVVSSTYLQILGDLTGESMLIFPVKSAERMVSLMTGEDPDKVRIMDEMSQSAYKEMSNIFTGAYLSSLADFLQLRIFCIVL